jgi:large conductance mechanosensitive channel
MAFLQEFKKFAMRGNAIDMAVGIVFGASFTNIVNALVEKVFTPITAYLTGNTDVSDFVAELPPVLPTQQPAVIGYGAVVQAIIQFLIVALVLFLVVRAMNRLNLNLGSAPVPEDVRLLREIRDMMAKGHTGSTG